MTAAPHLLTAKYTPPPARPRARVVVRPRLLARLEEAAPLTLVAAPAGFGKTTLVTEWAAALAPTQAAGVAWLALDADDNDLPRFLTYLLAALGRVWPEAAQARLRLLQAPQAPSATATLTALANDLAQQRPAPPAVLVLDDYHVIEAEAVHQAVAFLVDHTYPALRLVLTSRSEPGGLPLARWRARAQLATLGPDDLRFTPAEAEEFLSEVMGLTLAVGQGARLAAQAEGWAAGLQLAALAARAAPALTAAPAAEAALDTALDARHPYLADYLLAEVMGSQPPDVQAFLREAAVPERLTGALCDALTGRIDGAALLDQLARANLFLTRAERDDYGDWYRFHQLFRAFLQTQLQRHTPERVPGLHQRAAGWFAAAGLTGEAMTHALAAGNADLAAQLLAAAAPGLQQRGEFSTLRQWLARLPDEAVWANPRLCIARVWMLLDSDQPGQAQTDLARFDAFLAARPSAGLQGELLALRAVDAAVRREPEQALAFARQAEQHAPTGDAFVQPYVAFGLGAAYKMGFDSMRAEQWLRHAGAQAAAAGHTYLAYSAFGNLADVQYNTGRLAEAAQSNQRALDFLHAASTVEPPYAAWIYWAQARLHYEWNELPAALRAVERNLALAKQWGNLPMAVRGHLVRAQVLLASRRLPDARAVLDEADHLARQAEQPRMLAAVTRQRIGLALRARDLELARQLAATLPEVDTYSFYAAISQARVELAAGQPAQALDHLARAWQALEPTDMVTVRLQVLALEASARRARGQSQQAQAVFERALAMAQPGGFIRTFVDEGAPLLELLRRSLARGAAATGPLAPYAQRLLAAWTDPAATGPALTLTRREREILTLLAAGLSNRAIAEQLVVAETTLKRHVSNLYLKLDVHSRTQAVARATELQLL